MKLSLTLYLATGILFFPYSAVAQQKFDYFISNTGNNLYPGTFAPLARQTISSSAPLFTKLSAINGSVKVGLKSGDTFNENLMTSYPVQVGTYRDNNNQNDFAILNGTEEFSAGWMKEAGTENTFSQLIPYNGFTGYGINNIGSYSYIYVTEVNQELEKTAPFTARKPLAFVHSVAEVESNAGSFYSSVNTNERPKLMYNHTSDGNSPNADVKYRYEVTVKVTR